MVRPRKKPEHGPGTTLDIGKAGLTDTAVAELALQLKRKDEVKVRFHKGALAETDRKSLAAELARRADATLVEVRGNTAVLRRGGSRRCP